MPSVDINVWTPQFNQRMTPSNQPSLFMALAMLAVSALLTACVGSGLEQGTRTPSPDPSRNPAMIAAGFLDHHPDLKYRNQGLDAYGRRGYEEAYDLFRRAARYAEKASQAIVGEMLWIGLGTAQDRAAAHAWMSLATERGYRSFTEKRDFYWESLTPEERERATALAIDLNTEYSEAVAEPRLASALSRGRGRLTGSRVGSTASPPTIVTRHGNISGSQFYDPTFWDRKLYRQWHDDLWMDLRIGRVRVGDVEQVVGEYGAESSIGDGAADADESEN